MPSLNGRLPAYRLHKNSGQAVVTLNSKDHYLGEFGSTESRSEYDRLIAEWLGRGRQPNIANLSPSADPSVTVAGGTVEHLLLAYWHHAEIHYRKSDGTPTSELDNIRQAMRPLRRLYGKDPADQFGPKSLKAVREHMIGLGWCRTHINKQVSRIKSLFRWGVENEMVPPSVHHGLVAVKGLQRGRTTAQESDPVKPVPDDHISAIQPYVSRQVWALIQLQLLTGARPGELVGLRGIDLKTAESIWTVEPSEHKTAHHGHSKRIYFGPQAVTTLQPFLQSRPLDAFLFSPTEAEDVRREKLHLRRRTPLPYSHYRRYMPDSGKWIRQSAIP